MEEVIARELSTGSELAVVAITGLLIYLSVIVAVRLNGLRSFSKMSAFDFAMTIGVGTLMASTMLSKSIGLLEGLVGIAVLFGTQRVISTARSRISKVHGSVDNSPRLLMDGARVLEDNLAATRVTRDDLRAKLREANVTKLEQVRAVVLESTGDVSVLHAEPGAPALEDWLLEGVRR